MVTCISINVTYIMNISITTITIVINNIVSNVISDCVSNLLPSIW